MLNLFIKKNIENKQVYMKNIMCEMDCIRNCGCEGKSVIKKTTMAVSPESSNEGEEVIVRGQGWYMRLRALGTCAHILARLAIPALLTAYNVWLRSQRLILNHIFTHVHYALTSISMTFKFQAIGVFLIETKTKLNPLLWAEAGPDLIDTQEGKDIVCEVLYDPGPGTQADVIFIHGLKGSLYKTWKQGLWDSNNRSDIRWTKLSTSNKNEEEFESNQDQLDHNKNTFEPDDDSLVPGEYSKCWPRDWLPLDCPGVRIIAVNYSTDPFLWKPFWIPSQKRLPMKERGRKMMNQLLELGVGSRPIVWVGHSKGGLFVKQMLVHAFESEEPSDIALCSNSKAILFYSVPHRGSPLASIDFPLLTRSIELREVMADSLEVQYLQDKFQHLLNSNLLQVKIKSFIETKSTLMKIVYLRIVSVESADLGIGELYGVPLDHRDICKPKSRFCILYRELVRVINDLSSTKPVQASRQIVFTDSNAKQVNAVVQDTYQVISESQNFNMEDSELHGSWQISMTCRTNQMVSAFQTSSQMELIDQTAKQKERVDLNFKLKAEPTIQICMNATTDPGTETLDSVKENKNVSPEVITEIPPTSTPSLHQTTEEKYCQINSILANPLDTKQNGDNFMKQQSDFVNSITSMDFMPYSYDAIQDQCTRHEQSSSRFGDMRLPTVFNSTCSQKGETFSYNTSTVIQQVMTL